MTQPHPFYKTARWEEMRQALLRSEPLCRMCKAEGKVEPAWIIDHIIPHNGDRGLFFDFDNLQPLCKWHHDSVKQGIEKLGYSKQIGLDGWPVDPAHPANKKRGRPSDRPK